MVHLNVIHTAHEGDVVSTVEIEHDRSWTMTRLVQISDPHLHPWIRSGIDRIELYFVQPEGPGLCKYHKCLLQNDDGGAYIIIIHLRNY